MAQETIIRITGQETVNATAANVAAAINKLTGQVQAAQQQMASTGQTAANAFGPMKTTISAVTDAQGNLTTKIRETTSTMQTQHNTFLRFVEGITTGLLAYKLVSMAMNEIKKGFEAFAGAAIGFNAQLEQNRVAFTNLLGSADAANDMIRTMFKFAAETPFEFAGVVDATRRLLAYGFAAQDVIPMITAIGNAAAGLATGAVGIERITLALGQMMAKGKVQGQELRQLGEAGIKVMDIMKMVANKYGITLSEIIARQEQGLLSAQDFIDAFKKYSELKFGDMMFAQGKTFTGALTTISDNVKMVIAQGFEPLFRKLSEGIVNFAQFTKTGEFTRWGESIKSVVISVIDTLGGMSSLINTVVIPSLAALSSILAVQLVMALKAVITSIGGMALAFTVANPIIAGIAVVIGLVTAAYLKYQDLVKQGVKQQQEEAVQITKLNQALDGQGKEYLAAKEQLAMLQQLMTMDKSPELAAAYTNLSQKVADYEAKLKAAAEQQKYWYEVMAAGMATARQPMPFDVSLLGFTQMESGLKILGEEGTKAFEKIKDAASQMWSNVLSDSVKVGSSMRDVVDDFAHVFKVSAEDKIPAYIKEINTAVKDLGTDAQKVIAQDMVRGLELYSKGLIDANTLAVYLKETLWDVADAAKEAANAQRWRDMANEMAKGIGKAIDEADKAFSKASKISFIDPDKIAKEQNEIKKLSAELPQIEEQIRRIKGVSSAVDLNWKFPDPSKIAELEAKADGYRLRIKESNEAINDMNAQNAKAAQSGTSMWSEISKALGAYFAKFAMAQEEAGKITSEEADRMLSAYERLFGTGLDETEKFTLAFERATKQVMEMEGALEPSMVALGRIADEALKTADPVKSLGKGIENWKTAIRDAQDYFGQFGKVGKEALTDILRVLAEAKDPTTALQDGIKEFQDSILSVSGEGKAMDKLLLKTGEITQADVEMRKKAVSGMDSIKDAARGVKTELDKFELKLKDITGKTWNVVVQLIYTTPPPMPPPSNNNIPPGGVGDLSAFEPRVMGDAYSSAASIIGQIQDILKLFSGLAIDPRLKEMSDTVNSVVGAFADAMDALSKIANYTSPARDRVRQAYDDFRYIIDQLAGFGMKFVGVTDWEKVGQFGDAAQSMVSAFSDALDAIAKLKDYTSPVKSKIDQALSDMKYIVQKLVAMVDGLAGEGDEIRKGFADAASSILGAFSDGLEALMKLKDYTSPTRRAIDLACSDLAYTILKLLGSFTWLAGLANSDVLDKFGGAASSILSAFGDGIDALIKLKDYSSPARSVIDTVASDIIYIVDRLIVAFKKYSETMDWVKVQGFGEAGQSLLQAFSSGLEALVKIKDYASPAKSAVDAIIADLLYIAEKLINISKTYDEKILNLAKTFAETVSAIGNAIGSAADNMQKAVGFKKVPADAFGPLADAIERWVKGMVWMASKLSKEGLASAKTMAEAAGAIGDALDKVMEPMKKAALFPKIAEGAFGNMADAIFRWVEGLAYLATVLIEEGLRLEDARAMSEAIQVIGDALTGIMEPLLKAKNFPEIAQGAFGGLSKSIMAIVAELVNLHGLLGDAVEQVKGFAADLSATIEPFRVIYEIVSSIKKFGGLPEGALGNMSKAIVAMVAEMLNLKILLSDAVEQTGDFAGKLSGVIQPFQTLISVTSALVDLNDKVKDGLASFTQGLSVLDSATRQLVDQMKSWKDTIDLGARNADDTEYLLVEFADSLGRVLAPMSTVISVTSGMIDLAVKLKDGQIGLIDAIAQMDNATRWLVKLMRSWYRTLNLGDKDTETGEYLLVGYAESLSKILAPMSTVISVTSGAIDLAGELKNGQVTLIDAIAQMDITARWLVKLARSWYRTLNLGDKDLETGEYVLVGYSEALSTILSPMSTIISVTSGAIDLVEKLENGQVDLTNVIRQIDITARALVEQVRVWYQTLDLGAKDAETGEYLLAQYADALSAIISPIGSVISVTSGAIDLAAKLADGQVDLTNVLGQVDITARKLVEKVTNWLETLDLGSSEITTGKLFLVTYAENLSAVLSPMGSVISVASGAIDLAEQLTDGQFGLTDVIGQIDSTARALIAQVITWLETLDLGSAEIKTGKLFLVTYAENLSAVLAPMSTVISIASGMIDLAAKLTDGQVDLSTALTQLGDTAQLLVERMKYWSTIIFSGMTEDAKEALVQFAEDLSAVLSPMSTVISITSSMLDLQTKLTDGLVNVNNALTMLGDVTQLLITKMIYWSTILLAGMTEDEKKALVQFATDLGAVLSPMSTAISVTSSLIDLSKKLANKQYNWERIIGDVLIAAIAVIDAMQALATPEFKEKLRRFTEEFASGLQNAFGPLKTVVDGLNAIKTYVGFAHNAAGDIPVRIQMLVDDTLAFMRAFSEAAENIENPEEITDFGNALNAIIGPVKSYIDSFYWIWRYESIASRSGGVVGMPPQFTAIAEDMRLLILKMYDVVTGLDINYPGAIARVRQFSEDIQPLFTMVESARTFMVNVADYGDQQKMNRAQDFGPLFLQTVISLVNSFNAAGGVIQTLTTAMFDAGVLAGDALCDGIIQQVDAREPELLAMAEALGEAISAALIIGLNSNSQNNAAAGEEEGKSDNPNLASAGPTTVNIIFTGDIDASNPEDVQTLAEKIAQILGEWAVSRKNVTTAAY